MSGVAHLRHPRLLAAPLLSGALLLAMIAYGGMDPARPAGAEAYQARVRQAVQAVPYGIGRWTGMDVQSSLSAIRLLRPNIILQRRYTNQDTGESVAILIVHCGDVRDMQGHYPPNCYPAHGWTRGPAAAVQIPVRTGVGEDGGVAVAGETSYSATDYQFVRSDDGLEERMRVCNFFVLPGGGGGRRVFANIGAVDAASRGVASAGLGAGQVQILASGSMPPERREEVVRTFVEAIEPAIRVIAGGINGG
jgi:hypothetical protein